MTPDQLKRVIQLNHTIAEILHQIKALQAALPGADYTEDTTLGLSWVYRIQETYENRSAMADDVSPITREELDLIVKGRVAVLTEKLTTARQEMAELEGR